MPGAFYTYLSSFPRSGWKGRYNYFHFIAEDADVNDFVQGKASLTLTFTLSTVPYCLYVVPETALEMCAALENLKASSFES